MSVNSLEEIIEQLAQHITFCLDNHATVDLMKTNVLLRQKELHWDISLRQVRDLYERYHMGDFLGTGLTGEEGGCAIDPDVPRSYLLRFLG